MCGRFQFTTFTDEQQADILAMIDEIQQHLELDQLKNGDIYPTNEAAVLVGGPGGIHAAAMTWGFPHFHGSGVVINARSETVTEKKMFQESVATRRCVIPSTGFYEWGPGDSDQQTLPGFAPAGRPSGDKGRGAKIKYLFRLPQRHVLYMAGFWNRLRGHDGAERDRFVILTAAANASMAEIHDRMPVVLRPEERALWLGGGEPGQFFDRRAVLLERTAV